MVERHAEADWIGGFVAAEGTFTRTSAPPKFAFAVALGGIDENSCRRLLKFFQVGRLRVSPPRRAHYDSEVVFTVNALPDLVTTVIPFMDEHLPPSYKREQYFAWRSDLLEYWETRAKRVRPCTSNDCENPRRAHGLCRHHLYKAGLG